MTSANVFNWTAVNTNQTLNANAATSRSKADNPEVASMFASMMMPDYSTNSNTEVSSKSSNRVAETETVDAYDRYQYRDNDIDQIQNPDIRDKISEAEEELAGFEEEVTKAVAEELGLSEEQVVLAMEELGLTAFDLMDPQGLVQLAKTLTGAVESTELLTNPQFLDLMQDVSAMSAELMQDLGIPMEQMQEFIGWMDILEQPAELTETEFASVMGLEAEPAQDTQTVETEGNAVIDVSVTKQTAEEESLQMSMKKDVAEEEVLPEESKESEEEALLKNVSKEAESGFEESESDNLNSGRRQTAAFTKSEGEPVGLQMTNGDITANAAPQAQNVDMAAYLSSHTIDIIEQIVEKIKVNVAQGTSSMEMQLNPEHLGKVYLHISAQEGSVNAQITAANEAVKNALEAQIATLRENLTQAGVKVDAIEVTVASHEFERNLEQDQNQAKQESEREQQQVQRRNIRLSSLDELSSVMTEEEALVAQIMRDNGNSVDLTA